MIKMKNENISKALQNVKSEKPLTLGITNNVTINDCTNAMLAVGGTAVMVDDDIDAADFASVSRGLVINIGKLNELQIKVIKESCEAADKNNTPITIDPVGISVTKRRQDLVKYLLKNNKISCIRGNMSEIKAVGDLMNITQNSTTGAVGVDANETDLIVEDNLKENGQIVKNIAKSLNLVIVASGPIDLISDGNKVYSIENGDEMMPLITGSGCMLSIIVGTYITVNNPLIGAIAATGHMGIAGEKASKYVKDNDFGTGTFRTMLIDNLYKITPKDLENEINLKEII
jgi:hydroxyethylthiazole kinase